MAHFQDSRFLGISGRAVGVTFVIVAVVVGLFFIPEAIKFALNSSSRAGMSRSASTAAKPVKSSEDSERASLALNELRAINSAVDEGEVRTPPKGGEVKSTTQDSDVEPRPGFFSSLSRRGGASRSSEKSVIPSGLTLDKLGSKDFQGLVKQAEREVATLVKKQFASNAEAQEVMTSYLKQLELAAKENGDGRASRQLVAGLQQLQVTTIQALSRAGADRGLILDWLNVPVVGFLDEQIGLFAREKVKNYFVPRLTLTSVKVRQRRSGGFGPDARTPASLRVEVSYKGSDIDRVEAFANGRLIATGKMPAKKGSSERVLKAVGEAQGVWTFVAYDRYGAKSYWKSYSFYPRVRRFPQSNSGEYLVSFRPQSAPNSLDRYFMVGSSTLRQSSDSTIAVF